MKRKNKKPDAEIATRSNFFRWLENYWYHYKWHTIIIGVAVIILVVCLWQTNTTKKHDTVIVYAGPMCLSTNEIIQLQEALSEILPSDKDNNGDKSAAMNMYQIYSKEQILAVEKETDATGAAITVDRTRNTNQYSEFNHDIMTGQSSVYLLDPWIYNELKGLNDGGKAYLCELSFVFGDELPQGALEDGYGIRLGDTALYKEYSIVRRLPADTVICLMSPFGGLGQKVDDESYQYQIETFKALTTYVSDEPEIPETESYFVDEKEEDAA